MPLTNFHHISAPWGEEPPRCVASLNRLPWNEIGKSCSCCSSKKLINGVTPLPGTAPHTDIWSRPSSQPMFLPDCHGHALTTGRKNAKLDSDINPLGDGSRPYRAAAGDAKCRSCGAMCMGTTLQINLAPTDL